MLEHLGKLTNELIVNKKEDEETESIQQVLTYLKMCNTTGSYDTKNHNQHLAKKYFVKQFYGDLHPSYLCMLFKEGTFLGIQTAKLEGLE